MEIDSETDSSIPIQLMTNEPLDLKYYVLSRFIDVHEDIVDYFQKHDSEFYPAISSRSSILSYIQSIFNIDGRLIISRTSDKIVAIMGIGLNHPVWKYYCQYVAIEKEYRRKGLTKRLMEIAIKIFVEHGASRIVVRTWSSNTASQNNFQKHGFIHFDTVINDRGNGVHSCYFTKVLSPLTLNRPLTFLGIIGGMGTFSTGNYIKTASSIPRSAPKEQNLLPFLVVNDPSIPDRTEYIYQKRTGEVVSKVNESIDRLNQQKISHLLILCFTFHPFIPYLRVSKEIEIINLVAVCYRLIIKSTHKWLLIATKGTYKINAFGSLNVNVPGDEEKERIHEIIFEIKSGESPSSYRDEMATITTKNGCNALLLGCTDFHGMFGFFQQYRGVVVLDPLLELTLHMETIRTKI